MDLLTHIQNENAKTKAWVAEDPENRWAGLVVEDLAHWAEYGVYTVAQYERYGMESTIWDLYKDVTGIRPRHMDFKAMSDEELTAEYDSLLVQLEQANKEREESEAAAIVEFEKTVADTMNMGSVDRDTAIRWLREAEGETCQYDDNYFEYHNGLPYGYLNGNKPGFIQKAS